MRFLQVVDNVNVVVVVVVVVPWIDFIVQISDPVLPWSMPVVSMMLLVM